MFGITPALAGLLAASVVAVTATSAFAAPADGWYAKTTVAAKPTRAGGVAATAPTSKKVAAASVAKSTAKTVAADASSAGDWYAAGCLSGMVPGSAGYAASEYDYVYAGDVCGMAARNDGDATASRGTTPATVTAASVPPSAQPSSPRGWYYPRCSALGDYDYVYGGPCSS